MIKGQDVMEDKVVNAGMKREEGVIATLNLDGQAMRNLTVLTFVSLIIAALNLLMGLVLYFRPQMYNWGKIGVVCFIFMAAAVLLFVGFCVALVTIRLYQKRGGLTLTSDRLIGYGGKFKSKKVDIDISDIKEFVITKTKNAYIVRINGIRFYYLESPFAFRDALKLAAMNDNL